MTKRFGFVVLLVAALSLVVPPAPVNAETVCDTTGTRALSFDPASQQNYCGNYGTGCTECVDTDTGGSCHANGSEPCEPRVPTYVPCC